VDYVVVKDVPPYDGRYELDLENRPLTTREWGWVKRLAGYLPVDMEDENKWTDPEFVTVLALITFVRSGKIQREEVPHVYERLLDTPFDLARITLEMGAVAEATEPAPLAASSSLSTADSGPSLNGSSETSEPSPSPSGIPDSASLESAFPTSAR
jgi:hypothetical protein